MQEFSHLFGGLVIPVVVIILAIGFLLTVRFIASRYKKIPPTRAGILAVPVGVGFAFLVF